MAEGYPDPDFGERPEYLGEQIRQPSLLTSGEIIYGDHNDLARFLTRNINLRIGLNSGVILKSFEEYICLKQIEGNIYAETSHYKVIDELGKGGLGTVYKCVDKNSDMVFVIKRVILSENPMHMKSLDREVNTLLDFNHPRVIKIYGIIQRGAGVIDVLVEPWGESLKSYLTRLPQKIYPNTITICSWFYQILSVLNDFHLKGLAHCDIHFGNILIWDNQIKLCDFGSTKKIGERHGTQSHGISPLYFPPTVLRHYLKFLRKESSLKQFDYLVSSRLDTFAVGKLLLELMKGKIIEKEEMRPFISDKIMWDGAVKASIPENTPFEVKQVIIGLLGFTTEDSICTIEALQILLEGTRM